MDGLHSGRVLVEGFQPGSSIAPMQFHHPLNHVRAPETSGGVGDEVHLGRILRLGKCQNHLLAQAAVRSGNRIRLPDLAVGCLEPEQQIVPVAVARRTQFWIPVNERSIPFSSETTRDPRAWSTTHNSIRLVYCVSSTSFVISSL